MSFGRQASIFALSLVSGLAVAIPTATIHLVLHELIAGSLTVVIMAAAIGIAGFWAGVLLPGRDAPGRLGVTVSVTVVVGATLAAFHVLAGIADIDVSVRAPIPPMIGLLLAWGVILALTATIAARRSVTADVGLLRSLAISLGILATLFVIAVATIVLASAVGLAGA